MDETINSNPSPKPVNSNTLPPDITPPNVQQKYKTHKSYDRKVHGKRYSIAHKVAALTMANGTKLSGRALEKQIGMDRNTIMRIKDDPEIANLPIEEVNQVKDAISKLVYKRSFDSLKAISAQKLSESSALQLMTISAIGIDKGRLMSNESTANVSHRGVIEHISSEVSKLDQRLQALDDQ
jgi:hypothetical protein